MIERRRVVRSLPIMAAFGLGLLAACGGSEERTPGQFNFPRVRDGHQYYISEEERAQLQRQAELDRTRTPAAGT